MIAIFICNVVYSQETVLPNKKWEGTEAFNPDKYFQSKFRESSKTIDGVEYFELMYKVSGGWFEGVRQYFRQEDKQVFRWYEGEEKLILDFGLAVGDTIELTDDLGDRFEFYPIRTVDTLIFSRKLRKLEMRVKPENSPASTVPHIWIEGVGDIGFFFGNGYVFGNINSTPIFCVREGIPFYSAGMTCPDISLTNIPTVHEELSFVYDSRSKMIVVDNESIERIDIFSISGERIRTYILDSNSLEVDVSTVLQKLCVVVLFDGNKYQSKILNL